jgi:hypothetical protein
VWPFWVRIADRDYKCCLLSFRPAGSRDSSLIQNTTVTLSQSVKAAEARSLLLTSILHLILRNGGVFSSVIVSLVHILI